MPAKLLLAITSLILLAFSAACSSAPPPKTVDNVSLTRYAGTWYEIARFPQWFQTGCGATTATYTLLPDGTVEVLNRCHKDSPTGPEKSIKGTARSTNPPHNSKLKVTFFWPFEGDYWIFHLNPTYTTAAVGSPDRKSLWILHRGPKMDDTEYTALTESLKSAGFDITKLQRTAH